MSKKILIINGHPREGSLADALAGAYAQGARQAGHTVQVMALRDLQFDPILWNGYARIQPLEPDLQAAQEWLMWCQHLVIVYPTWWGSAPALLKGFVDRVFLPGFAFKYKPKGPWWDRLLAGRSARLITTMDSPTWWYRIMYGRPGTRMLRHAILKYCGIRPVRSTRLGEVRFSKSQQREGWLQRMVQLGQRAG